MNLPPVLVSRRNPGTWRPELTLSPGPAHLAQPGAGSYAELYGCPWAIALHRDGPQLYQLMGETWIPRADPGGALAELVRGVRHVTLAWDQAARPVVAWELTGQVYVRQWSPQLAQYVTRGPWPGCDPVLICDATLTGTPAGSDVLLLHLAAGRGAVIGREQQSSYATARTLAHVGAGSVLDQAAALPYALTVYGEANRAPWVLRSGLYPLRGSDVAAAQASGLSGGALVPVVIAVTPASESVAAPSSGLSGGALVSLVIAVTPAPEPVAAPSSGLSGGALVPVVILRSLPGDVGTAQASGLSGGALARVVVLISPPVEPVAAGVITPLGGVWNG